MKINNLFSKYYNMLDGWKESREKGRYIDAKRQLTQEYTSGQIDKDEYDRRKAALEFGEEDRNFQKNKVTTGTIATDFATGIVKGTVNGLLGTLSPFKNKKK